MNASTNISRNISWNKSSDGKFPFIANALAIACEVPVEDVYVAQHLSLPEFLFTACMIVVALTAMGTFWSLLMKVEIYVARKWTRKRDRMGRQKVLPEDG